MIEIGRITKPQGLKGEFRVVPVGVLTETLASVKQLTIKGVMYTVEKCQNRGAFCIFKVSELTHIDQVEPLRNTPIFADVELVENKNDLSLCVGFTVSDNEGALVGTLTEVSRYGAAAVLTIQTDKTELLAAAAEGLVLKIDRKAKTIVVDGNKLKEVSI